jgi:hypothetical protein
MTYATVYNFYAKLESIHKLFNTILHCHQERALKHMSATSNPIKLWRLAMWHKWGDKGKNDVIIDDGDDSSA